VAAVLSPRGATAEEPLYPHAERTSGPWGYIDKTGKIVVPLQYQAVEAFSEGLAAVKSNYLSGYIDRTGRVVVDFRFRVARPFQSGRAIVSRPGGWDVIDAEGRVTALPNVTSVGSFHEGRAVVVVTSQGRNKAGAIDPSGRTAIEPQYARMEPFSEGLAAALLDGKWGFIDKDGAVVIPFELGWAASFSEGRARVLVPKTPPVSGFIDKSGNLVIPFDRAHTGNANDFKDGLATVSIAGKGWGAIDREGRMAIPPQFPGIGFLGGRFSEGLLAVTNGKAYGYVDKQGRFVVQPRFTTARPFKDGLAAVAVHAGEAFGVRDAGPWGAKAIFWGVIDRSGKLLVKPIFDRVMVQPGGMIQVTFGDRMGYLDATGRPLTLSQQDIDDYAARKEAQLKRTPEEDREEIARLIGPPPPPGRGVVAKAGDTDYYLRLPESMRLLDSNAPPERKLSADLLAREVAEQVEAGRRKQKYIPTPFAPEAWQKAAALLSTNAEVIVQCNELQRLRATGVPQDIRTYAIARGLQQKRYNRVATALSGAIAAVGCAMIKDKASSGRNQPQGEDQKARIRAAFERAGAGETTELPAILFDGSACYSVRVAPADAAKTAAPGASPKATVKLTAMQPVPDWLVHIVTEWTAPSPDAVLLELEVQGTLVRALAASNPSRTPPGKGRP
jgi:hypothetical protein